MQSMTHFVDNFPAKTNKASAIFFLLYDNTDELGAALDERSLAPAVTEAH